MVKIVVQFEFSEFVLNMFRVMYPGDTKQNLEKFINLHGWPWGIVATVLEMPEKTVKGALYANKNFIKQE